MKQIKRFLEIRKHPDPVLRAPNEFVKNPADYINLVQDMIYTNQRLRGAGLAAPQVGYNIQLLIAVINKQPFVAFNPQIVSKATDVISIVEGCFSLPDVSRRIDRPSWIEVKYQDLKDREHVRKFEAFDSIVINHELDHLDGKLMIDYDFKDEHKTE